MPAVRAYARLLQRPRGGGTPRCHAEQLERALQGRGNRRDVSGARQGRYPPPLAEGEVFVAELKFWDGPASLAEAVQQVRERLTWRDAFGVAILLARNADFGAVLHSVSESLSTLPGVAPGSPVDAEPGPEAGVVQPRLTATRAANHLKYQLVASGLCPTPLGPYHYSEVLIDRIGQYVILREHDSRCRSTADSRPD